MKTHIEQLALAALILTGGAAYMTVLAPASEVQTAAAAALTLSVPTVCPSVSATLSVGSAGAEVSAVQQYLIGQGFLPVGSNTGSYDLATQTAVQQFQSEVGIVSSGTPATTGWGNVGPITRSILSQCAGLARDQKRMQDVAAIAAAVNAYKATNASYPGSATSYYWIDDNNYSGGAGGQCAATTGGLMGYLSGVCTFKDPQGKHYALQQNGSSYTVGAAFETSLAQGAGFTYKGGTAVSGYYLSSGNTLNNPAISQQDIPAGTTTNPTITSTNCATLLTSGYPMGGFGTDYYESGGNVVTVAEMKADGWNLDGINYSPKSDAYLNEVAAQGICTIYTPSAWTVNNALATRIFNEGVFSSADQQSYLAIVQQQVQHILANSAWDNSVAGWYISESNNESSAYMQLVAAETNLIHQLDSKHRPVLTWASRTAPEGIGPIIQGTDGLINGYYIGFADQRSEFLFAAERAQQMQASYGAGKLMIIAPPMCESTTDWQNQCGPAMGVWTSAQIQSYIGKYVRHDLYTLIASGMRGFMVFSLSDRVGFADFDKYYGAYKYVVSDLRTSGLYDALMNTKGTALSVTVTSGTATVGFNPSWDGSINETFPSVNARQFTYGGKTYVVVANTSTGPVTVTLSGVTAGGYTDYIRGGTATASGGSMSVSITGMDAAVFISNTTTGTLQNGTVCTAASQCSSGYCYPGPESKNYCIARDANCAQPGTDGVAFGTNYTYNGLEYSCVYAKGLQLVGTSTSPTLLQNGVQCTSASQCASNYCYPGPEGKNYCIAKQMDCAKPGTDGINYGTNYTYNGLEYSCVYAKGLQLVTTTPAPAACSFNGSSIASGQSVTAYQSSSVAAGSTCVSQTRTCTNGTLSGSYAYASCTVQSDPGATTRDATRQSDIGHIQAALTNYKNANGSYPGQQGTYYWISDNNYVSGNSCTSGGLVGYLPNLCSYKDSQSYPYAYERTSSGGYRLGARFELPANQGTIFQYGPNNTTVAGYYEYGSNP